MQPMSEQGREGQPRRVRGQGEVRHPQVRVHRAAPLGRGAGERARLLDRGAPLPGREAGSRPALRGTHQGAASHRRYQEGGKSLVGAELPKVVQSSTTVHFR